MTDATIVGSVREGLIGFLPQLRGFARFLARNHAQADDLVQETVLRALSAQDQFVSGTSLKAWLFTIQRNIFLEQLRKSRREREVMDDYLSGDLFLMSSTGSIEERQHVNELEKFLWELPPLLREALLLVGAHELSHEEAAQICEVPLGTIKARVSRARAQLQKIINDHEQMSRKNNDAQDLINET